MELSKSNCNEFFDNFVSFRLVQNTPKFIAALLEFL